MSVDDGNSLAIQEVAGMEQSMCAHPTEPAAPPVEKVLGQSVPSCFMYVICMILYLFTGTRDLSRVYFAITKVVQWTRLGLALGLDYSTLQRIEREKMGRIEECKMEMLSAWLQQKDDVVEKALPTWNALETALRKIGEYRVAEELSKC